MLKYDLIIVGGGIIGAAISYHYSSKYPHKKIALLEQGNIGEIGVTFSSGGIIRKFEPNEDIQKMAIKSYDEYLNFHSLTGMPNGFVQTGLIYNNDSKLPVKKNHKPNPNNKISISSLEACKNSLLFEGENTVLETEAGYVDTRATTVSYINAAKKNGVVLHESTKVTSLQIEQEECKALFTNIGTLYCDKVVLACGVYNDLCKYLGSYNFRNKLIQYLIIEREGVFNSEQIIPVIIDEVRKLYVKPHNENELLVGKVIDVYDLDIKNLPSFSQIEEMKILHSLEEMLGKKIPFNIIKKVVSCDLFNEDRKGTLSYSKQLKNCVLAMGWSGHGIKIAPEIAKKVTAML